MENKHTPAPWKQDGLYVDAKDGSLIATIHSEDSTENEANGRLIAAAPELLNVCQQVFDGIKKRGRVADDLDLLYLFALCETVIKKAIKL